jgi:UDP-N-acetylmuramate: L-alanyl-gamma-D-glutamyl-meso-diaminopimelate ligase
MQVHFIAIGGSVMHNLAIALHKKGYTITGSDDSIFDPSYSKLKAYGLLPQTEGWNTDKIHTNLDAVILGMHAKPDNPELQKAKELGLKIYSFPEYLYEQTKDKKRVVIGGSHGKTTITSMVMHVMRENNISFDYMVGSQISGFETMVHLDQNNEIAVFEGDEYLSSPIDERPKFHQYKPHVALLSGIAWDHINVFPTFENYKKQFSVFIEKIETAGSLIYYKEDKALNNIVQNSREDIQKIPYQTPTYTYRNEQSFLMTGEGEIPLHVFGRHNLSNIEGARLICHQAGIDDKAFYKSIQTFEGASKRLQLIRENNHSKVFLDFAHAPSKVKATVDAAKEQYPDKKLIAALELHTFSSLTAEFLHQYKGTMEKADHAIVYYNPKAIEHKGLKMIEPEEVKKAFGGSNIKVFTDIYEVMEEIQLLNVSEKIILVMSSGNLGGLKIEQAADDLLG